jgi:hypothetical protein
MCIMEVRPRQHDSTIAQAMHHNTATVVGDLHMWLTVLEARAKREHGDMRLDTEAAIGQVRRALSQLTAASNGLLGLFGAEVGRHVEHWQAQQGQPYVTPIGEAHGPDRGYSSTVGNERIVLPPGVTLAAIAAEDAHRARKFETR